MLRWIFEGRPNQEKGAAEIELKIRGLWEPKNFKPGRGAGSVYRARWPVPRERRKGGLPCVRG